MMIFNKIFKNKNLKNIFKKNVQIIIFDFQPGTPLSIKKSQDL